MIARLAHGSALLAVLVALLATGAGASANTITTIAGGGTDAPPYYDQPLEVGGFVYANPLDVKLPAPTGIAWSGDPKGLFYVLPGNTDPGKCAQLWVDPDATTGEYGMAVEGGTIDDCNPLPGGYFPPKPVVGGDYTAKEVKLKNPCCVTSNWHWDRNDPATGPLVASSDSGHVQFYSWKTNTGFTKAGSTAPADCSDQTLQPDTDVPPTAAHFCNIAALAQNGFPSLFGWYAFAEQNRGANANVLYWVDNIPQVHALPLDPGNDALPLGVGGLAWDRLGGLVISDGLSAIHRLQRTGGFWTAYRMAGARGGSPTYNGDGGAPLNARFNDPNGLAVGFDNALYIADTGNCRIRKLSEINFPPTGTEVVTTVAGSGCHADTPLGDAGPADEANLDHPAGVAMASTGLLITDTGHNVVRLVDRTSILNPPALTADNTPTFDIRSLDSPSHLECKVDDVEYSCDAIGPLADGVHTLEAWENGDVGTPPDPPDPTPAVAAFTVDATPPSGVGLVSPAAGDTVAANTDFSWTAGSDAHAGTDHYELWLDGGKNRDVPTSACANGTCVAKAAAPLGEGPHTWQIRAVDALGNTATTESRSLVAGGLPTAAFTISPNPALAGRSVTFDASTSSDESGISHYEWDLDGDGAFETDGGTSAKTTRSYPAPTTVSISLRVTDGMGKTSAATQASRSPRRRAVRACSACRSTTARSSPVTRT